jgi:hypothetical protein
MVFTSQSSVPRHLATNTLEDINYSITFRLLVWQGKAVYIPTYSPLSCVPVLSS